MAVYKALAFAITATIEVQETKERAAVAKEMPFCSLPSPAVRILLAYNACLRKTGPALMEEIANELAELVESWREIVDMVPDEDGGLQHCVLA